MAEKVHVTRTGRTKVGIESTFGTLAGTMVDCYPEAGGLFSLTQEQLPITDERPTKFAAQKNAIGPKSWAGKLSFRMRPAADQLLTAETPATTPQGLFTKALLGGEHSGAGSTCDTGATTTSIPVQTGHGSRFAVGCWVAVEYSGQLYPRKVTAISTDTLTVAPALPGSPSSGDEVINGYCYYPTQSNTQSLSLQHAKINAANLSDYDQQWELRGGTGDLSLVLEPGKVAMLEADLRGATWTGPSSAPGLLPAPAATETQGAPWVLNNTTNLWCPAGSLSATHVPMRKMALTFNGGMVHLPEYGGVEGRTGVQRVGDGFVFGSCEIEKLYDPVFEGYYGTQDTLWIAMIQQFGTGVTARFLVVEISSAYHTQKPEKIDSEGVLCLKHSLEFLEDTTISNPSTDLARSPIRVAWL